MICKSIRYLCVNMEMIIYIFVYIYIYTYDKHICTNIEYIRSD